MLKQIDGYTGYYVNEYGQVFCDLGRGNRNKDKRVDLYEIRPRLTRNGYARICARNDITGNRDDLYIHRIVASCFIPNPDNKKYVNHINCIRSDNRVENLEWVTAKENADHTMNLHHVIRNDRGQYVSNYIYEGI